MEHRNWRGRKKNIVPLQLIPEYQTPKPQTHPDITRTWSQPMEREWKQVSRTSWLHQEPSTVW